MKPDAPAEIRGEFTHLKNHPRLPPGLFLCDQLPKLASIFDKLAIVRNLRFAMNDHKLHEVYTGFPTAAGLPFGSPPARPAFGSVVSRLQRRAGDVLPHYVSLGLNDHPRTAGKSEVPAYLGGAYRPFDPTGDGVGEHGKSGLALADELTIDRLASRRALLGSLDQLRRTVDHADLGSMDSYTAQALDLLSSPKVREALDLSKEPASVRARYGPDYQFKLNYQFGHTWHSSKFLLARRLVEAGVPVVTLAVAGWDDHGAINELKGNIFERLREKLPLLDNSIHALVTDLHERGLDKDVAVVVWGEFGRTPIIDPKTIGRHHWAPASFALFAGGGLKTGQVIGETDARAAYVKGHAYGPQNVLATLYHVLGIDPGTMLPDYQQRPVALLEDQEPIRELV